MKNIKRLIFDLDNTLILWVDDYTSALRKTMEYFKVDYNYMDIDAIVESQEKIHEVMNKQDFLNDINEACGLNLNIDFIDMLLENQKKLAVPNDIDLQETIKYLSTKYELVLLTNWYTDTQKGRLETAGIAKYFKEFYGGDLGYIKPHPDSFLRAIGSNKIEQCIMIGDSDYHDIEGAIELGMPVIQVDLKNKIKENRSYPVIKNIKELKDIL
jgi:HAD superfamily hydrolase (TIGR01509 family)